TTFPVIGSSVACRRSGVGEFIAVTDTAEDEAAISFISLSMLGSCVRPEHCPNYWHLECYLGGSRQQHRNRSAFQPILRNHKECRSSRENSCEGLNRE